MPIQRRPGVAPRRRSSRCRRMDRARHRPASCKRAGSVEQRFRLLRRMRLDAIFVLHPLLSAADRQHPVRAHLKIVVERLHRAIVEGVARLSSLAHQISVSWALVKRVPRKFGIGFALRQMTSLRIQNSASCNRVPTRKMLIAADHPDRAVVLEDAARLGEPFAGEIVIGGEAVELVPVVIDGIDPTALGRNRSPPSCRL